ncbi:unnamed protein product [Rotaria sp. Silwood1]|nr:unnamed protein product [Rotaria sp. Silwood1]CAF5029498.1 unnamed protein product [Rotaria sp. Silwood1]
MFFLINLLILFIVTHQINGDENDGRGASASSTEVGVGCFSADSSVILNNGQLKQIDLLKTGDQILTINHNKIVSTDMIFMLDKETSKQAKFYTFITDSGHKISLTSVHLIPILSSNSKLDYIPAKQVKLGDQFYVNINGKVNYSPVQNITIEYKKGYFAPLTMTGTLLVNDVYSSCYALAKSHKWSHLFMTPFRWYYKLTRFISINDPFDNNRNDGIYWIIDIIHQLINYIQPSILQSL